MSVPSRAAVARCCESLTGASREIDCDIGRAIGAFDLRKNKAYDRWDYVDVSERGRESWPGHGGDQLVPNYTGSLDQAMRLAVKGYYIVAVHEQRQGKKLWSVQLGWRKHDLKHDVFAEGKHLPAVLCAAWLLAGAVLVPQAQKQRKSR